MKTTLKLVIAAFVLVAMASAQTALTQTSLSAAITSATTQNLIVASATGITVTPATMLYIDKEAMLVLGVNSTTITVARGQVGTASVKHANSAMVLAGTPSQFYTYDPTGGCTTANTTVTPWVNVALGRQWLCSTVTLTWVPGFGNFSAPAQVNTAVASVAGLTTITGPLFHVTGTNIITGWTLPVGESTAPFCIIPDGAYQTTATNNIAVATTGVLNKLQCWTWDATNSKFVASY